MDKERAKGERKAKIPTLILAYVLSGIFLVGFLGGVAVGLFSL